ncbi:MAG: acetyltransferase [Clostridia bacterium]|nr:acetyltransferase [Clostridia bacterium]
MNRLIIIGASGHGKVVADIAALNGYKDIVFLDDDETVKECAGYPVVGKSAEAPEGEIFVAVGNAETRQRLMTNYKDREQPVLIHPSAVVAKNVQIGSGSVVMAGAVINPGAIIGKGCIINTSSSVDHDCIIDDFCHISVGAHLAGTVTVGECTWIGTGVTVSNNVNICGGCMIGAGAVVIKDISISGTYIGVPAKIKN